MKTIIEKVFRATGAEKWFQKVFRARSQSLVANACFILLYFQVWFILIIIFIRCVPLPDSLLYIVGWVMVTWET